MKVLLLILSSNGEYYRAFKETWKSYMNSHKHIDSFFIELHPDISSLEKDDNVLAFEGEESFMPGCLQKTVLAMQKYIDEYDYVVRTNLSSVVHLPRLYKCLEQISDPLYYAGVNGYHQGIRYCSGALFIMSKNVASYVSQHADINSSLIDDVCIGHLITQKYGLIHGSLHRQESILGNIEIEDPTCFHYRFKSSNRHHDIKLHREYTELIYFQ